ncbi:MAG TPA: multiheme c-type cytochrome, partial [Thermoanaerobaculia bacterium]|nr:multiheme c-type cytochrome [Thermoanaerobaculia bacterium]
MKRLLFASALAAAYVALAQTPAPPPVAEPETLSSQPGQYVGAASCATSGCHGSTLPLHETRILQNEYYTWLSNDRHAKAYNVLFDDRSARIVRNMHLKKKANDESLCLDCHTTN